jgi:hypothetical protein
VGAYYGESLIDQHGAAGFSNILKAWYLLFSEAPELIKLKGNYTYIEGEDEAKGQYERLYFNKQDILKQLNRLMQFCERVKNEGYVIIYLGI